MVAASLSKVGCWPASARVPRFPIDSLAVHFPSALHCRRMPTETPMPIAQTLLPQFDHEMANTRRMLALVPAADAAWKPHPKSYALGDLAAHIATVPMWGRLSLELPELDLGSPANAGIARVPFTTTPELLARLDRNVDEARAALAASSDADLSAV